MREKDTNFLRDVPHFFGTLRSRLFQKGGIFFVNFSSIRLRPNEGNVMSTSKMNKMLRIWVRYDDMESIYRDKVEVLTFV